MEKKLIGEDSSSFQDRLHWKFEIAQQTDGRWQLCCFANGAHLCVPDGKGGNKDFATAEECVVLFKNPTSTDDDWGGFLNKIKRALQGGESTLEIPDWLCDFELERLANEANWSPENSTP